MRLRGLRVALLTLLGALAVGAFFEAGKLHGKYEIRYAGVTSLPEHELVFYLWYALWGGIAVACLAGAFHATLAQRFSAWLSVCATKPREVVAFTALLVFMGALLFRHLILLDDVITDDELVYQFTARSLGLGRFASPPPLEPEFLGNQFMIVNSRHWYGKYPIGHSLLLAPFEIIGRSDLFGPAVAVGSVVLTYLVARRFVGGTAALLAVFLLGCSPHFVWTHATLLSQTSSGLLMLLSVYAHLLHRETQRLRWLLLMGASLGFGILTRPMPGVLIALAVSAAQWRAACALEPTLRLAGRRALREGLIWLPAMLPFMGGVLLSNYVQSGSPWTSGYSEVHAGHGLFSKSYGVLASSVGGALLRENAWLFGWPCSFLFLPFARIERARGFFWMLVGTTLAYRLLVPKTVVSTTGPVYLTEVVPFLCIGSAAGMVQVVALLRRLGDHSPQRRVASVVVASFLVALLIFPRVELPPIRAGAQLRTLVGELLLAQQVERAVVFASFLITPNTGRSWAYFPPNPWPDLRDAILYLRLPDQPDGLERARALWRERFPDRPAFLYDPRRGAAGLAPLESVVAAELAAH